MKVSLAIDFGSTYTKIVAVDLEKEKLVAVTQHPSTVDTDITIGLYAALSRLKELTGTENLEFEHKLASSAAGGHGVTHLNLALSWSSGNSNIEGVMGVV